MVGAHRRHASQAIALNIAEERQSDERGSTPVV
ncbi:MAG: hypothetical protein N838_30870 [Thiohalocapsa sp. PB-PSB1]|nr:MAG: hypothetical protein N838_30870 [Thiohalocapsa sp. PB-PSB1]